MKKYIALAMIGIMFCGCKLPVNSAESKEQIIAWTEEIGAQYSICPELLQAIIERESNWNPNAAGAGGTYQGLMQIAPKWQKERMKRLGVTNLYDPYINILVGAEILIEKAEDNEDVEYILMAFNGGDEYAKRMYSKGKVSDYASGIIKKSEELERNHDK